MPPKIAALPVDPERGYPIPFFVDYVDGKPEFRIADGRKWMRCIKERLCWVCGQKLGRNIAFVIGPMCSINRVSADPGMHFACAEWSAQACPFLTKPQLVRRENGLTESYTDKTDVGMIDRNPGVSLLWVTREFNIIKGAGNKYLFALGRPESVSWWREGRSATRTEIEESMRTELPLLEKSCDMEETPEKKQKALESLRREYKRALELLPA